MAPAVHNSPKGTEMTDINQVYRERNMLACALARSILNSGGRAGRTVDPQGHEGFCVVVVVMLPTGRVGWHMDERDPARPWAELPEFLEPWESFPSEENTARLWSFLGIPVQVSGAAATKALWLQAHDRVRAMIAALPDIDFEFVDQQCRAHGLSVQEALAAQGQLTAGDLLAGVLMAKEADSSHEREAHVSWRRGQMALASENADFTPPETWKLAEGLSPDLALLPDESCESFTPAHDTGIRFEPGVAGEHVVVAVIDADPDEYTHQGLYWLGWSLDAFSGARLLVDFMFRGGLKAIRLVGHGFEIEWHGLKPKPHPALPEYPCLQVREPAETMTQFSLVVISDAAPSKDMRVPIGRHEFLELVGAMLLKLGYAGVFITSTTQIDESTHVHSVAWER